jgi:hypothetical protein
MIRLASRPPGSWFKSTSVKSGELFSVAAIFGAQSIKLGSIFAEQRVLVSAVARPRADPDFLVRPQIQSCTRNLVQLGLQPVDNRWARGFSTT